MFMVCKILPKKQLLLNVDQRVAFVLRRVMFLIGYNESRTSIHN